MTFFLPPGFFTEQGHDSCSLCGKEETTDHMIFCDHPSWLKLRCRYITALRAWLKKVNTNAGLLDTFCSAISDWFGYGAVDLCKYPAHYHQAILQQTKGWRYVFMGHLATSWSVLQISIDPLTHIPKALNMWTTSIVEVFLRWFINLGESRNKDVHGHTKPNRTPDWKQNTRRHSKICLLRKYTCVLAIIDFSQTTSLCSWRLQHQTYLGRGLHPADAPSDTVSR